MQLEPYMPTQEEKDQFNIYLQEQLPACFRINPIIPNHEIIEEKIRKEIDNYQNLYIANPESMPKLQIDNIKWVN